MTTAEVPESPFPAAEEDVSAARLTADTIQTRSTSYRLSYTDDDFLLRDELRPARLQLELLKPELLQQENGIHSTIVIFGSSRIPDNKTAAERLRKASILAEAKPSNRALARKVKISERILENARYYDEARELGRLITAGSFC
ncbi:MAG: hypothetical protein LJE83_05030 [Gammaproteobacteria bacterium]|jgi:hypothetical protein|nr:hypothetical protein [Gammaproteobacteria bacterium]